MKKFAAILLAIVMMLSMAAMAQSTAYTGEGADGATITISNASKGETYSVYKLFDATVTGKETTPPSSIAYQGTIPESLTAYFENVTAQDGTANYVKLKDGVDEEALFAALKTWAESATATAAAENTDGAASVFTNLPYGYYVVTSTQNSGAAVTVTSTNPNAKVYDKNTSVSTVTKGVDDSNVYIGQKVTYTVEVITKNYEGSGSDAQQIASYTVADTLPEWLSDVTVTSAIVDNDANLETTNDQDDLTASFANFGTNKSVEIAWAEDGDSKYDNGAKIVIVYEAIVNDAIETVKANTNTVTVTPSVGDPMPATANIYTYEFNIKKVDENGDKLDNAQFELYKVTKDAENNDVYTKIDVIYDAELGAYRRLLADEEGVIIVIGEGTIYGLDDGDYVLLETQAPNGYNKLTTYTDASTIDGANGDEIVVENRKGSELPSTGGMGTTIFYVVGGMMMAAALVLLVSKRKVAASK